ncbi:KN motif and ankyrin repeat domain-containing protein 4 isoform X1 [Clupea harengus]|uniref:KN motif and ankyrin repeat domain-containing protein 4 isoform X1 n=1 Tax=Clupea harengus TaxID=7950 RepID=A0A6P8FS02_CLUHA|nr:KN motif and ankyrin repeat domain-containing protein 4 isoform X1 [Clupea harengus]XP_031430829.1 KN motif and ankyrin repeat domain-containing protein 4 isoform X1 [Clupea harengus]XP_031430830.1 KN motif and ankyrin repeat domain-containing protein 4 isoform X1 [Clupea harengus]XP_031430831.1 KN motif and ankyrin repeat domain-containing protein 4 isoform X1 [Clupea harengus]XP_031430832.1 KN motif and ankyrin repeat domain-containing protein 4 isoform X1 [Clupea harengus]XP_031430833.1 
MMDKKSANGYPSKAPEGGSQRKQIPYSVETPYGFHLDLDFLKYVDDIEKGNTIKRVHIQRKNRGPKYSTLPRNFSLPGHGARPPPKDMWASGTSTLGPRPKSRVTEVQQIFDFKPSDGGSSSLSRIQGTSYSPPPRPAEEVKSRVYEEQPLSLQLRPNLLRTSSMPGNVPRRKGSDSSEDRSPVALGESQKENGSYERLFRADEGGDRRGSVPQDRASLHVQITNALKRVRELEEQVRTIPELKSQIGSLQDEREQLLKTIQEQEQKQQQPSPVTPPAEEQQQKEEEEEDEEEESEDESPKQGPEDSGLPTTMIYIEPPTPEDETKTRVEESESAEEEPEEEAAETQKPQTSEIQTEALERGPEEITEALVSVPETETRDETSESITEQADAEPAHQEETQKISAQEFEKPVEASRQGVEQQDKKAESPTEHFEEKKIEPSEGVSKEAAMPRVPLECPVSVVITEAEEESEEADLYEMEGKNADQVEHPIEDSQSLIVQTLQAKLQALEEKLNLSSLELKQTNALLREQVEENRVKDERIQELSERAEELAETAKRDTVENNVSAESQPQPVLTSDASVCTDSERIPVSEKAVCTDEEAQPSNGPKETDLTCSSTQTTSVEAKDMEVLAQVLTSEKEVGVEIITCDQAVETEPQMDMASGTEDRNEGLEELVEQENVLFEAVDLESTSSENVVSEVKVLEEKAVEDTVGESLEAGSETEEKKVLVERVLEEKTVEDTVGESLEAGSETEEKKVLVERVLEEKTVEDTVGESLEAGSETEEKKVLVERVLEENGVKESDVIQSAVTEPAPAESEAVAKNTKSEDVAEEPAVTKETVGSPSSSEPALKSPKEGQPGQEAQSQSRRSSSEGSGSGSASSPAANVVTRIQGLLNEQWSSLGSGSPEASQSAPPKPPQPSKFSSIQSQLVSSLSVLSAFYSPGQKEKAAAAASRQSGLKSIMKKDGCPQKPGNGAAKKNLKFVGVNGGYESTSSEESSGEENQEEQEQEDSSEPEEDKDKEKEQGHEAGAEAQEEADSAGAQGEEEEAEAGGPEGATEPRGAEAFMSSPEQPVSEVVDKDFMAACYYLKDRRNEVDNPNKEMRQVLMILYQEWFRVSSQKDSQAEAVTLYLREVGNATPTLLSYIVNLADGNGNTALHYTVSHSNFPVVKLLLDTELCEVDHQNKAGYTAIMLAALTAAESPEDVEVAKELLQKGNMDAHASQTGQTALMLAVSHGRTAMVRVLLSCGADVNVQDRDGSTALMCACEHGHAEITRMLLKHPPGCDTSLKDKDGHTALSVATQASHMEVIDLLKAHTGTPTLQAAAPH